VANSLLCPKCKHRFSVFDVTHTTDCPTCKASLEIRGQWGLSAVSFAMFIVLGGIAGAFAAKGGVVGWSLASSVFAGWIYLEVLAARTMLSVHLAEAANERTAI
jgi:hypothetical protein